MKEFLPFCVLENNALLGESPIWSPHERVLYWVDILKGNLHRFDLTSKQNETIPLGQLISSVGLCAEGGLIISFAHQVALFDFNTKRLDVIATLYQENDPHRLNDCKCDAIGRFWCGSRNDVHPSEATAALFCVGEKGKWELKEKNVMTANGMGWSPDNRLFYFIQTLRHTIYQYDFDLHEGRLSQARPFITLDPEWGGEMDGLTVDEEGCVWVAIYGKGQVIRFDPEGKRIGIIDLPVPKVTSCSFGGENRDVLFITTAREGMTEKQLRQFPLSGSLFAVKTNTTGLFPNHYRFDIVR
jgi:sugar lactone lactonase YvrE